jgi:molecular chaperone DnaJ
MNFYITLGLGSGASDGDIRRAYRRLARRFHPGINPGDQTAADRFQQILAAYEVLIDPERRRQYDSGETPAAVAAPAEAAASSFEFQGFDFSVVADGRSASTFGDLFADVIRAAVPGAAPARGADLHGEVQLTFDQAMQGASCRLTVMRLHRCVICDGRGRVETVESGPCTCDSRRIASRAPAPACSRRSSVRRVAGRAW